MKICPVCQAQLADNAGFCPNCGTALGNGGNNTPNYQYMPQVQANYYDHTAEFAPQDISENKAYCMLVYLFGIIGVIVALLASKDSPYIKFHVRQAIKFQVLEALMLIATLLLFWTVLVPIAAGVMAVIFLVLKIICFFQICGGKAVEPAIVRSIGFLK